MVDLLLARSRNYVANDSKQQLYTVKVDYTIDDIRKYAKVKIHWAVAHTKKCSRVKEASRTFYESRSSSGESPLRRIADFEYTLTHTTVVEVEIRISRGRKNVVARNESKLSLACFDGLMND